MVVGAGWVSPLDFWRMSPGEVWWLVRARMPKAAQKRGQDAELYRMLKEAKAKDEAA